MSIQISAFSSHFYCLIIYNFQQCLFRLTKESNTKRRFWHRCFPVNFTKFLRTQFLQNTSGGCFCPGNYFFIFFNFLFIILFKKESFLIFFFTEITISCCSSLYKTWSFPLEIYSVNLTKSACSCGFGTKNKGNN